MSFEDYLQQRIFLPAGMTAGGIGITRPALPQAIGYSRSLTGELVRARPCVASFGLGAEAGYASAYDLYRFDRALWSGELLSAAGRSQLLTPRCATPNGAAYGYGWFIEHLFGRSVVSARGATAGFAASLQHVIDEDLVLVVLLNHDFTLDRELTLQLTAIALGEPWQPLLSPQPALIRQAAASWSGRYEMAGGSHLVLRPHHHRLLLEDTALKTSFEIHPLSPTTAYLKEQNARLTFHQATDKRPLQLQVLYGTRRWQGHRISPDPAAPPSQRSTPGPG